LFLEINGKVDEKAADDKPVRSTTAAEIGCGQMNPPEKR